MTRVAACHRLTDNTVVAVVRVLYMRPTLNTSGAHNQKGYALGPSILVYRPGLFGHHINCHAFYPKRVRERRRSEL